MVQMRAPRSGGVTGWTQMATMALALAMALVVDDLRGRPRSEFCPWVYGAAVCETDSVLESLGLSNP
jgi:hypothetical protein